MRALLEIDLTTLGKGKPISERLSGRIDARFKVLLGKRTTDVLDSLQDLEDAAENLQVANRNFLNDLGIAPPACPEDPDQAIDVGTIVAKFEADAKKAGLKPKDEGGPDIRKHLDRIADRCNEFHEERKSMSAGGVLAEVAEDAAVARRELAAQERSKKDRQAEYAEALKAYTDALKLAEKDASAETKKRVTDAVEGLRGMFGNAASVGAHLKLGALEEQIEKIDLLLKAAAEGKFEDSQLDELSDEEKGALAVAAQLPSFAGRLAAIAHLRRAPLLSGLLLEKARLKSQVDGAQKAVARIERRIRLLGLKQDVILDEISDLVDADKQLRRAVMANKGGQISVEDLLSTSGHEPAAPQRFALLALARYLFTFTGPRRQMHEIEYRLVDIQHARVLDNSETALALWQTAVQQPVEVLAAYHGSGIKTEDIIELLRASGLFAIATGVN